MKVRYYAFAFIVAWVAFTAYFGLVADLERYIHSKAERPDILTAADKAIPIPARKPGQQEADEKKRDLQEAVQYDIPEDMAPAAELGSIRTLVWLQNHGYVHLSEALLPDLEGPADIEPAAGKARHGQ